MYERLRFCAKTVAAGTDSSTSGLFGDAIETSTFFQVVFLPA